MKSLLKVLAATGLMMFSTSSYANFSEGIMLNLGLGYEQGGVDITRKDAVTQDEETYESSGSQIIINLSAGYSLGNGFIVGGKYYSEVNSSETTDFDGDTSDGETQYSTMGIMAGYNYDAFLVMGSYLLLDPPKSTTTDSEGDETGYSEGSGFILDFSYMFDVGGFQVGPQVSYISFTYEKYESNGTEDTNFVSRTDSKLQPQFAFTAIF